MATYYQRPVIQKFEVGDTVRTIDKELKKEIHGKVTEVGDESFEVKWEDLDEPTEYNWCDVAIENDLIIP